MSDNVEKAAETIGFERYGMSSLSGPYALDGFIEAARREARALNREGLIMPDLPEVDDKKETVGPLTISPTNVGGVREVLVEWEEYDHHKELVTRHVFLTEEDILTIFAYYLRGKNGQ